MCLLSALAARLSRTRAMLELHITGREGAALAPDHGRQILTGPTTEFQVISLVGVVTAFLFAIRLRRRGPLLLRGATIATVSARAYLAGCGVR